MRLWLYRVPEAHPNTIDEEVDQMVQDGLTEKSLSPMEAMTLCS